MIIRRIQFTRLALLSVSTLLVGVSVISETRGLEVHSPTPSPCAADGTCRPNGPWGHSRTRWRPWPGDALGQQTTTAEEIQQREQFPLDPFELPSPEDESQRGPKKSKRKKATSSDEASEETPEPQPVIPMPDEDPFEGFDLQGDTSSSGQQTSPLAQPSREDIPPALPSSLRRISRSTPRKAASSLTQTARQPHLLASNARVSKAQSVPSKIVQASTARTQGFRLDNPAAASVEQIEGIELRQAIHFKAVNR